MEAVVGTLSSTPAELTARLRDGVNGHDLDEFVACFEEEFQSEAPAHPARGFRGAKQVRENWARIFAAVPDLRADLIASAADGDVEWAEWDWHGTRLDGTPHRMRGVTVMGPRDGRAAWVRFYMEPVDQSDASVAAAITASLATADTGTPR